MAASIVCLHSYTQVCSGNSGDDNQYNYTQVDGVNGRDGDWCTGEKFGLLNTRVLGNACVLVGKR